MSTDIHVDRALSSSAYERGLRINAQQAEALAALLWDGELRGTTYPNVDPPRVGAIFPYGTVGSLDQEEFREDRKTGEKLPDPDDPQFVAMGPPMPPSNTILVLAEDGQMWSIVRAGICWPVPLPGMEDL